MCYESSAAPDYFPQRFCLICVDTQQIQYLFSHRDLADLGGFFSREPAAWLEKSWWLWSSLARPVADVQHVQSYTPSSQAPPAAIERLPNELLDEILDYLSEEKRDVLALGLSSAFLWSLIVHRVQSDYARSSGALAGKRMLYLGQGDYQAYLTSFGPPPTEETRLFHSALFAMRFQPHAIHDPRVQSQITKSVGQQWAEALASAKRWNLIDPAVWKCVEQDLTPTWYPQDRVWVLRNLTTCEFVRSDKLKPASQRGSTSNAPRPDTGSHKMFKAASVMALLKQGASAFTNRNQLKPKTRETAHSDVTESTPLTFAQIFLVLTCYSREAPYNERCFGFQEGRWAGHAFDIVTWDIHNAETKPHEWADVSELAVDDVANLRHWVQQLDVGRGSIDSVFRSRGLPPAEKQLPRDLWQHILEDRMMFHDWEGLDTQSAAGAWKWSQKPVQRGLLVSYQGKSDPATRR